VTGSEGGAGAADGSAPIVAVTLDFGNTLVPVSADGLRRVVQRTAQAMAERLGPFDASEVLRVWDEERERQFREDVPRFREVDLAARLARILARLRGMTPPPEDVRWDDTLAAARSTSAEIAWAIDVYSRAFVDGLPAVPEAGGLIERLAGRYRVGILSNWPLAVTIDRYAEAAGWTPHLGAIVVSQRVGMVKPHPAIFQAAREALGNPAPGTMIHVGDDWAADIVGARRAGWRAAYVRGRPADSPLPTSVRDSSVSADLELRTITELEAGLARLERDHRGAPPPR
jgi:putative hydrolase of the HAD superfamily